MELPFIYILFRKFKKNILIIISIILLVLFCFLITNVKATTVDLSDYSNCSLVGDKWVIIYSYDTEKIYLLTLERSDYAYVYTNKHPDSTDSAIFSTGGWVSGYKSYYSSSLQGHMKYYTFNYETNKFENRQNGGIDNGAFNPGKSHIIASNVEIRDRTQGSSTVIFSPTAVPDVYYPGVVFKNPYIFNSDEELVNQTTDKIIVNPGSVSQYNDSIDFTIYRIDKDVFDDDVFLYNPVELYTTELDWTSLFYKSILDDNNIVKSFNYQIPYTDMGITFEEGKQYQIELSFTDSSGNVQYVRKNFIRGNISETEKLQDSINAGLLDLGDKINTNTDKIIESNNKTQEAIKEQTEVSKNIFEKIGDILSYINPFSPNFFVYKLIELLLEMLKSLFIPSDNFFNDWLVDMNDYFSDRFGILYYPIDLVIDFLTRVVNISSNIGDSCILTTSEFSLFGTVLLRSFTFDFNTIIENETFKNIYNIYLVVMDVILSLMLINFAKNTFAEVFGGRFSDEVIGDMRSGERSYNNYVRHQENKQRYNKESGN